MARMSPLHVVEQRGDLALFLVGAPGAIRAGADDLPQDVFLPDDVDVIRRVRRRRREGEQVRDERRAAHGVEQIRGHAKPASG